MMRYIASETYFIPFILMGFFLTQNITTYFLNNLNTELKYTNTVQEEGITLENKIKLHKL